MKNNVNKLGVALAAALASTGIAFADGLTLPDLATGTTDMYSMGTMVLAVIGIGFVIKKIYRMF